MIRSFINKVSYSIDECCDYGFIDIIDPEIEQLIINLSKSKNPMEIDELILNNSKLRGMPMINNGLTIIAFCGFLFEKFLSSDIPSRLLGVCSL